MSGTAAHRVAPGDVVVVVPAGGTSRRMGGTDKTALDLAGRTVLEHLLDGLTGWPVVVVAPPRGRVGGPAVRWVREDPPGAGPLAALAAGLRAAPDAAVLVAVAGDQPFAGPVVPLLLQALADAPDADVAAAAGSDGRAQPLLSAYRTRAVGALLRQDVASRPVRLLAEGLRRTVVRVDDDAVLDVDDPADAARALAVAHRRAGA
ncbi:molybdenum cofactor guanylyltransferase [Cellulomonas sp. SLBN-39]|uniref:molybdenum cofactor guanylyltransferase n=1 Tax=Cellulomonas sp. SLBN-39 TaxID=2768446 RepID=UPI00114EE913|nr:NTP transferase domain-containing protein [Cellulomonas sp. SLBN-39]TQL04294.1 molybdopterin-guanine dinucleotide biosynthesis protein A [Cellulomonas sp. SLBN-39]